MANELTLTDMGNMAKAFAQSGFFGYKNSSEAFTLMCLAQANGLHPAKAAERYHIIQGRPAMKADAMLAAFQESGGKVRWVKRTEKECTLHLSHPQGGELDVTWSIDRATKAGLTGKSTWKQYPTQMLSARCVSEGVRALYPACLCGMYTPEEVADFDAKPAPQQPQPTECEVLEDNVTAEVVNEEPAQQSEPNEPPKAAKTQDEKDANWLAMCDELRERNPEIFDKYLTTHNVSKLADIKGSKDRQKLYTELKSTIDFAEKEANNG
jgi:hypothetical protein